MMDSSDSKRRYEIKCCADIFIFGIAPKCFRSSLTEKQNVGENKNVLQHFIFRSPNFYFLRSNFYFRDDRKIKCVPNIFSVNDVTENKMCRATFSVVSLTTFSSVTSPR